jgi:hypothetical protein
MYQHNLYSQQRDDGLVLPLLTNLQSSNQPKTMLSRLNGMINYNTNNVAKSNHNDNEIDLVGNFHQEKTYLYRVLQLHNHHYNNIIGYAPHKVVNFIQSCQNGVNLTQNGPKIENIDENNIGFGAFREPLKPTPQFHLNSSNSTNTTNNSNYVDDVLGPLPMKGNESNTSADLSKFSQLSSDLSSHHNSDKSVVNQTKNDTKTDPFHEWLQFYLSLYCLELFSVPLFTAHVSNMNDNGTFLPHNYDFYDDLYDDTPLITNNSQKSSQNGEKVHKTVQTGMKLAPKGYFYGISNPESTQLYLKSINNHTYQQHQQQKPTYQNDSQSTSLLIEELLNDDNYRLFVKLFTIVLKDV